MELIENDALWEDIEELELVEFGIPRRIYIRANHFHNFDDFTFFKKFRLTKETVMNLLPLIEEDLEFPTDINRCVSPINQLLTGLRYYATGSHLDVIADFIGIHSTTAVRIIPKVTRAIARLYRQFVTLPRTLENRSRAKRNFFDIARFPHVIGAIDCTHVKIISPGGQDAEIYRNRKGYFSLNVQAISDADLKFVNVVARWPGSTHDSTIFNGSNVCALFENGRYENCLLLGDSGYPNKNFLMTPLLNPTTQSEQRYNESQIRTRNKIECCFGVWKRRFPVLAYGCRLRIQTTMSIIIATAVLHNLARQMNEPEPGPDEDTDIAELNEMILNGEIPNVPQNPHVPAVAGAHFRRELIENYFARL